VDLPGQPGPLGRGALLAVRLGQLSLGVGQLGGQPAGALLALLDEPVQPESDEHGHREADKRGDHVAGPEVRAPALVEDTADDCRRGGGAAVGDRPTRALGEGPELRDGHDVQRGAAAGQGSQHAQPDDEHGRIGVRAQQPVVRRQAHRRVSQAEQGQQRQRHVLGRTGMVLHGEDRGAQPEEHPDGRVPLADQADPEPVLGLWPMIHLDQPTVASSRSTGPVRRSS
jgi:hypothetical protein